MATLLEDRVVLWDTEASRLLHESGFFGKPVGERLQLSLVESAYLLEKGKLQLTDRQGRPVDLPALTARAEQTPSTCSVIGLLANSGPMSTFLTSFSSPVSAIVQRSFTYVFQERTKAQLAHPEIKTVLHAF